MCVQYFFDQTPLLLFLHCLFCAATIFEDGIYIFEKSADINIWLARAGMYGGRKGLIERLRVLCVCSIYTSITRSVFGSVFVRVYAC